MRRSPSSCRGRGFRIDGKGLLGQRRGPVLVGSWGLRRKVNRRVAGIAAAF